MFQPWKSKFRFLTSFLHFTSHYKYLLCKVFFFFLFIIRIVCIHGYHKLYIVIIVRANIFFYFVNFNCGIKAAKRMSCVVKKKTQNFIFSLYWQFEKFSSPKMLQSAYFTLMQKSEYNNDTFVRLVQFLYWVIMYLSALIYLFIFIFFVFILTSAKQLLMKVCINSL